MSAHMSEKEARRAGLIAPKAKTTRKRAPKDKRDRTRCVACDEVFETAAAETRHVEQVGHHRYETVLT